MPMTLHRRCATPLRRTALRAAVLLAPALTAACGSLAEPTGITAALSPDYRSMIAKRLKNTFKDVAAAGGVEISDPRWAQSNKSWGWMVCIHFPDRGHQRTYVYFFDRGDFVDERYAVQTDHCEAQTYSAFDLGPAIRPGAVGDPGPLY
jgi:hypothetical protein